MRIAGLLKNDMVDGLGFSVSLWTQGCPFHCKGCHNEETWDFNGGKAFDKKIEHQFLELCKKDYIKNICILGGEPMEPANQKGLLDFVKRIKQTYPNKTIWCYSGYLFDEELLKPSRAHCPWTKELLSYIDILVDGEFKIELKDITLIIISHKKSAFSICNRKIRIKDKNICEE